MQPYYEKIPLDHSSALYVKELKMPQFDAPRHFHPEYEIMTVFKSRGKRFVGDNISDYSEGDLVFLGSNLPHSWHKGEGAIFGRDPVHAVVIQFSENLIGKPLIEKLEMSGIKGLFEKSARGVRFGSGVFAKVSPMIYEMVHLKGFKRIISLMEILNALASVNDFELLSSAGYKPDLNKVDNDRIDKIYRYILDHYLSDIELEEAASLLSMNKSSFCHFFKKRTRKSFTRFVNEIRIGHAAKLLVETPKNISEICFECGFKNLSNFNRRFKEINKMSPIDYRRQFHQETIAPKYNFTRSS